MTMKFLIDFFPLLAFFIAFKLSGDSADGILLATAVLIVASCIQIIAYWLIYQRFEKMHLITLVVVLLLGGATLYFKDERFIQWKPTIVMWVFALIALGSQFIGQKNIFQYMIQYADHRITAPNWVWMRTNLSLVIFFLLVGAANLYVAFNFDRAVWVNFKVFGITAMNVVFMFGVMLYVMRHASFPEDKQ